MTAVQKILAVAAAEIGTKENPANSNRVKYNTEYYGNDIASSSRAWCCAFVWWVFKHAGYSSLFYGGKKCAGCTTLMNYHKAQGQLVSGTSYLPGDLVFFQFDQDAAADHIGIIEKDNGNTITTIEGNTSTSNDSNGGAVMRRTRKKSLIMAVVRPAYSGAAPSEVAKPKNTVTIEVEQLKKGARGESVRALQLLLIGCSGEPAERVKNTGGADGVFGAGTVAAVKAFQKLHGLTVDGIVGKNTWAKLLGA